MCWFWLVIDNKKMCIRQVFQFRIDQENRVHNMFAQELIPQMFSNIKSLFKLHHDFFLPRLEERVSRWEQERRIGDIMTNFAPFLKMYAEYVRNFDHATHLISTMTLKSSRFAAIIDEIQVSIPVYNLKKNFIQ